MPVSERASESTFKSWALKGVTRFVSRYPLQAPKNSQNTLRRILANTRRLTRYTMEKVAKIKKALNKNTFGVSVI